jgi:hypothetical protein
MKENSSTNTPSLVNQHNGIASKPTNDNLNIEQAKRELVLKAFEDGSYKKCIYAGIIDQLEKAKDLTQWDYNDKDDVFLDFIRYLLEEGAARILTTPATASMETRLRRYAEKHTRQYYVTPLIRRRNSVKRNKYKIDVGSMCVVTDDELSAVKSRERREAKEKGMPYSSSWAACI